MIALNLRYDVFCDPCGRTFEIDMTKLDPAGRVDRARGAVQQVRAADDQHLSATLAWPDPCQGCGD